MNNIPETNKFFIKMTNFCRVNESSGEETVRLSYLEKFGGEIAMNAPHKHGENSYSGDNHSNQAGADCMSS